MPFDAVILLLALAVHSLPTTATANQPSVSSRSSSDHLPAAVGAIFAAYGLSLVFVAITLLALAKKRRDHLRAEFDFSPDSAFPLQPIYAPYHNFPSPAVPNFSYPSPTRQDFGSPSPRLGPSPTSTASPPKPLQHEMAGQQLEDMYKHVMEHEAARLNGQDYVPSPSSPMPLTKEKPKPSHLTINEGEKPQSKAQGFLAAIRTPRKKTIKGVNISSPIMSPHPSPYPTQHSRQFSPVTPSSYAPSPSRSPRGPPSTGRHQLPLTPEISPHTIPSIDEHLDAYLDSEGGDSPQRHQPPIVGLPRSPKPGSCFPPVSSVPKLGNVRRPSAVREGGLLPLRAYDPEKLGANSSTTIQTVLERKEPEGPMTGRSPLTAASVPYSPYQPYTPCMPITPSLVTREDRKRMKKMMPKTPTTEMVKSTEEVW
ncbi:hypothetical protein XA68_10716 [Ophiocordyceps unilateralis]|uniref:Uncharacterized protein n=1 Tax=Ophiocordyceps unilateralis TaxID=268505 RepID=A0A2A9PN96_OPHUN|nr:hypothetical protein XA68_10716 [Ophiocordyceps unilateralis]